MDSQGDSQYLSRQSKRAVGQDSQLIVPRAAFEEQQKQLVKIAEAEIDELKQSLRYVEIQLAQCREERETFDNKILESQQEVERCQDNMNKQIKVNLHQAKVIDELQKKLDAFNNNQKDLAEKTRFKAGNYMNEINQRDEELAKMRSQVMNCQDEMKLLTVSREQFRQQNDVMREQLRDREKEVEQLRLKVVEQSRMIDSLCTASKHMSMSGNVGGYQNIEAGMDKARESIERAERIAKTTNKSSFMSLGEKNVRLMSEEGNSYMSGSNGSMRMAKQHRNQCDDTYLQDDSVPAEIFTLIQVYRERVINSKGGQQSALIIDDFFSEAHSIIKDAHMREIAKIRNEHSVEIMKLRKNLEGKLGSQTIKGNELRSKENFKASKQNEKYMENELEKQRRALVEENEILKKRCRAVETIANSGNQEKQKFMEGASWIAKKSHVQIEQHIGKIQNLVGEFQKKARNCIIDERINELNGKEVLKVHDWLKNQVEGEIQDVGAQFDDLFQNVNFHLREATKEFTRTKKLNEV